jgi:hypothetical protein
MKQTPYTGDKVFILALTLRGVLVANLTAPRRQKKDLPKKFDAELHSQNFLPKQSNDPPLTSSCNGKRRRDKGFEGKEAEGYEDLQ